MIQFIIPVGNKVPLDYDIKDKIQMTAFNCSM